VEHTIALIKPDAWGRMVVGRVYEHIEMTGLEIHHVERVQFDANHTAVMFYGPQHHDKPYFEDLCNFMASGPCLGFILAGDHAISIWRTAMGPAMWPRPEWSIRGKYCIPEDPIMRNLVHGSDSRESFLHEVNVLGWRHKVNE